MELIHQRLNHDKLSTLGEMSLDGQRQCYILEDAPQEIKIPGKTRIPAGRYRLELKGIGESRFDAPMKKVMGKAHKGMIRLVGVPEFSEVLIHIGNYHQNTEGCLLVGDRPGIHNGTNAVWKSGKAYKEVYPIIADAITCEEVWLTIKDEVK